MNRSTPPVSETGLNYIVGLLAGAVVGLFGAYIFSRADRDEPAGRRPISNGQIFAVLLSSVTLIRQIAEMGKQPQKK